MHDCAELTACVAMLAMHFLKAIFMIINFKVYLLLVLIAILNKILSNSPEIENKCYCAWKPQSEGKQGLHLKENRVYI